MFTAMLLFALSAPTEPPKAKEAEKEFSADARKELKKLEGKWRIVKLATADKESESKDEEAYFTFKGTELTLSSVKTGKSETVRITAIDPTTDPTCIDLLEKREGRPDQTVEGVYKIDGDTLQFAFSVPRDGKNRPTSFEKPGERVIVWTLKRVKE